MIYFHTMYYKSRPDILINLHKTYYKRLQDILIYFHTRAGGIY